MRSLNHFEAVTILREASNDVTIRVHRNTTDITMGDTGQASVSKPSHSASLTQHVQKHNVQVVIALKILYQFLARLLKQFRSIDLKCPSVCPFFHHSVCLSAFCLKPLVQAKYLH